MKARERSVHVPGNDATDDAKRFNRSDLPPPAPVYSLTPGLALTPADEMKVRTLRWLVVPDEECAICGAETPNIARLRMRDLPLVIVVGLCDDHLPKHDATDAELDRLEKMLLEGDSVRVG